MDKILLKNSIRLVVGGSLYDGGDVHEIPAILREIADEYEVEIKKVDDEIDEIVTEL